MRTGVRCLILCAAVTVAGVARSQPPGGAARGCCCVVQGVAYNCSEKTQADCLTVQPSAPVFPKMADWHKAWDAWMAASEAQASKPTSGGWIAETCADAINPATGEPRGAPSGCCCFPKLDASDKSRPDCKAGMTRFDCKAECASFKDGRLPSGCTWATGACAP